jgi:prevent-host-death family protein
MIQVTIHEAKMHLSRLLRRVALGEEVVIARGNKPVARLVPIKGRRERAIGGDRGLFQIPRDFDAPLPHEILRPLKD